MPRLSHQAAVPFPVKDIAKNPTGAGNDEQQVSNEKDIEVAKPSSSTLADTFVDGKAKRDPSLVTWRGPDDPENPKNWPKNLK